MTPGRLRLAVPDKRFTFDRLRRTTELADVLEAYALRRRVPSSHCIVDFTLNAAKVDVVAAWNGTLTENGLERMFAPHDVLHLARDAERNGTYHDVHCWVFTPRSFVELMVELARVGLQPMACEWISDTAPYTFEFFVSMVPAASNEHALASWQRAREEIAR